MGSSTAEEVKHFRTVLGLTPSESLKMQVFRDFFYVCSLISLKEQITINIPVVFQVTALLAALIHPSQRSYEHRVIYAPGVSENSFSL
ncbi:hypothetical protein Xmir_03862 [Xenorhabdus miraniensis]|uniref:Uncharacterized protein n=2 Tax=Xenorhabdus miraniensis TaxID=351674 RepID=A0A2D0JKJ1_9GAMM|nr:hypothetical protein Xmir_04026 [Xenorhabdus miraniensis]PHM46813.1 hypothetical protein Xmir_03862 [Xenorhabdus miraniensis]